MASDKISITGERIRDLYEMHSYSQKEFADYLGISTAQLRRYEKDPDQAIRSDLLVRMAERFHVSTDYLLGLTPVSRNNHELTHLNLTEAACEKLVRGEVSGDTLSRLMEHDQFGPFTRELAAYFDDSKVEAISIQNEMATLGAAFLRRHASETRNPANVEAAATGLESGIADARRIQLEDLTAMAESIMRETKEKIDNQRSGPTPNRPSPKITRERLMEIAEETLAQRHLTREEQIEYSADLLVEEISKTTGLKGTAIRVLKPVFRSIFRKVGKQQDKQKEQK